MVKPAAQDGIDAFALTPWLKDAPLAALMVNPVAAMAATTAIGFGIAGHFAGLMADAMQDAAARSRGEPEPEKAKPVLTVVPAAEKPARKPRAAKADDLKAIPGIGPKLEQVLNGMGCRRYGDIAAWTAAEAEKIDAELGLDGRITRDGWVEQAKALAKARG